MNLKGKKLLVCNCEVSMPLDGKALAKACGAEGGGQVHTQLCRAQIESFKAALAEGQPVLVGCTQEAPLFEETRAEVAPEVAAAYVNIRERAGWAADSAKALPKMAALVVEAALDVAPTPTVAMASEGRCLVYGRDEIAIAAAKQLAPRLSVTLLLTRPEEVTPPRLVDLPIFQGTVRNVSGRLGAFQLEIEDHAPVVVSSRQALGFETARSGVTTQCDLILDLSGEAPLVPAHAKRDGYFKPDIGNPAAVQRALFDLTDLVGEFEKPRYVDFDAELCAHARSQLTGCTRCLDVCPASAIEPDGDVVAIDPYLCGGCGACNSVCPTGAAGYAYPPTTALLKRLRTLLGTYRDAGGAEPVLLIHDDEHGGELISLMARFGRGLPANVIPFAVNEITQVGLDVILGMLAYGGTRALFLVPPKRRDELEGLRAQIDYAEAIIEGLGHSGGRLELVTEIDPEAVEARLHELAAIGAVAAASFLPLGNKRTLMRLALQELHKAAPEPVDQLPLPEGAPFGRVIVDTEGCTVCLACVGACPTGALQDNPERPELRFQEEACVQCGLCRNTCPEKVIALESRIDFTDEARQPVLIKEEEPFECIRCGKPFGAKSSIEKIVGMLAERHAMYQDSAAIERLKMCDDCRVIVQFEAPDNPLAGGPKPATRTTEDYLREREEIEAARRKFKEQQDGDQTED